jgi:flagellar hook-associated protein 1
LGGLSSALVNAAQAISVYDRQLATVQNNVTNSSTPGYAKQTQVLEARPFDLDEALSGGVAAGPVVSSRSEYAEENVRQALTGLGTAEQQAGDLASLQSLFSVSTDSGVAGSLNTFFGDLSQLAVSPNDTVVRQSVIDSAGQLADNVNQVAEGITGAEQSADSQIGSLVDNINQLAGTIQSINQARAQNVESSQDAGLDANLHATLEQLAEIAPVTMLQQADGTVSIYLGGQAPLVIGTQQFQIQADFSSPQAQILDSTGQPVTTQVTGGQLGGLLQETNQLYPSYLSNLDTFASGLADTVNQQLSSGVDSSGAAPTVDLFSYNGTQGPAMSLAVTDITPDQIAAASPGAPGGNGNALALSQLESAKTIKGYTFTQYFGNLGANLGNDVSNATNQQQTQQSMVDQARSQRDQISGVSLDEEATQMIQIEQNYQAVGKMLTLLDSLADVVINIIPTS